MLLRIVLAGSLLLNAVAVSAAPGSSPAGGEPARAAPAGKAATPQVEEKFVWGLIGKAIASQVFSALKSWLINRLTGGMVGGDAAPETDATASSGPQTLGDLKANLTNAAVTHVSNAISSRLTGLLDSLFAKETAPVVEQPKAPLTTDNGEPNYQGVHIAVVGATRAGRLTGFRPVNEGFRTGERIKLRVVSTFDGVLTIVNVNPKGERKQVYPPGTDNVVSLKAGEETFIPLGRDQFFEFAGATGTEQLVVTLVDPRALEHKASERPVYRQDEPYGSNFVQEVESGSYPAITQAISLIHY